MTSFLPFATGSFLRCTPYTHPPCPGSGRSCAVETSVVPRGSVQRTGIPPYALPTVTVATRPSTSHSLRSRPPARRPRGRVARHPGDRAADGVGRGQPPRHPRRREAFRLHDGTRHDGQTERRDGDGRDDADRRHSAAAITPPPSSAHDRAERGPTGNGTGSAQPRRRTPAHPRVGRRRSRPRPRRRRGHRRHLPARTAAPTRRRRAAGVPPSAPRGEGAEAERPHEHDGGSATANSAVTAPRRPRPAGLIAPSGLAGRVGEDTAHLVRSHDDDDEQPREGHRAIVAIAYSAVAAPRSSRKRRPARRGVSGGSAESRMRARRANGHGTPSHG